MTDDNSNINVDTSHISEHTPDTDIDQYIPHNNFRIERMGPEGVWVCAYTNDDRADHHYDISCRDGGLHITHRAEKPQPSDYLRIHKDQTNTERCPECGGELEKWKGDMGGKFECPDCGNRYSLNSVSFLDPVDEDKEE